MNRLLQNLFGLPQTLLLVLVRGYRFFLSPWLGSACRFTPTCSAYALDALQQHGAAAGSYLTVARLVRCHPWCTGGHDPVPASLKVPRLFTALLHPHPVQAAASPTTTGSTAPPTSPLSPSKTLP